jgi:hypothetical protein
VIVRPLFCIVRYVSLSFRDKNVILCLYDFRTRRLGVATYCHQELPTRYDTVLSIVTLSDPYNPKFTTTMFGELELHLHIA